MENQLPSFFRSQCRSSQVQNPNPRGLALSRHRLSPSVSSPPPGLLSLFPFAHFSTLLSTWPRQPLRSFLSSYQALSEHQPMWPVGESFSRLRADVFPCLGMYLGSSSCHLGREQSKAKWPSSVSLFFLSRWRHCLDEFNKIREITFDVWIRKPTWNTG